MTATQIESKIADLRKDELIATDEGTHAQPKTIRIYERLDGTRYGTTYHGGTAIGSCSPTTGSEHGRMRQIRYTTAAARRNEIGRLQQQLSDLIAADATKASRKQLLERGWDGPYLFVGIERGREIAATL